MLLCFRFHFFNHGKQRGDRILRHPVPDIPVVEMVRHANNDGLAWYDEENNEDRWRETDMRTIQIQKKWFEAAKSSGISALEKFATQKEKRLPGLAAHAIFQISTGKLEGFNNKIKVAKRIGYGYRDEEFL